MKFKDLIVSKRNLSIPLVVVGGGVLWFACSEAARARINFIHKSAGKDGLVASAGNFQVTEANLKELDPGEYYRVESEAYSFKMREVMAHLTNQMLNEQAKLAGVSVDQFIQTKIAPAEKIVASEKEFSDLLKEKGIPADQVNSENKSRILDYIAAGKRQNLIDGKIAELLKSQSVTLFFEKPKYPIPILAGDSPMFGKKDAPVTLIIFSDFQCPYCGKAAETMTKLKEKFGKQINFAFRNYPLPMHPNAKPAAEAALCANEQGSDKFWKYHDILFKNQSKLDSDSLKGFAKEAGLKVAAFEECVKDHRFASKVEADHVYAQSVGIKSTPTFYLDGQLISGALPTSEFEEMIKEALGEHKS